jgi:hypothetical protein
LVLTGAFAGQVYAAESLSGTLTEAAAKSTARAASACPQPRRRIIDLGPNVWWVAGEDTEPDSSGDPDPHNRGLTAHLLAVRQGPRLWLLGAGPSPAAALALNCQLAALAGQRVTDVINPWPQATVTLGNQGFAPARWWAHTDVAAAMQRQCPHCEAQLRQRLGPAAEDLGPRPIRLPSHSFSGDSGPLGPFHWWRLWRAPGQAVTLWRLQVPGAAGQAQTWWMAPGLLWGDGPPDLRDASLPAVVQALETLRNLAVAPEPAEAALGTQATRTTESATSAHADRWLPTQGAVLDGVGLRQQLQYAQGLVTAVRARQLAAGLETEPAADWRGPPWVWPEGSPAWATARSPWRHALNWQRAWRQMEAWEDAAPVR